MTGQNYKADNEEMTLTHIVEEVLKEDPQSRTDAWRYFTKVLKKLHLSFWIDFKQMHKMPSPESILKMRRDFMNTSKGAEFREDFVPEEGVKYEKPEEVKV